MDEPESKDGRATPRPADPAVAGDRRAQRAAVALLLAIAGLVAHSVTSGTPPERYWPPALVAPVVVPLAVLLLAGTRAGRPVALLGALVATPLALVTITYQIGLWQLPAVAALWWTFVT